jgi:hypothetical protein
MVGHGKLKILSSFFLLFDIYYSSQIFILDKKPGCHLFCLANDVWQSGSFIMATWNPLFCETSKKVARKFLANWHFSGLGINASVMVNVCLSGDH